MGDGTTTFANTFTYAAHGGLKSEAWGNGAVHSMDYNRHLQASEVKLKQSSTGRIDGFINGAAAKEWDQRFVYD